MTSNFREIEAKGWIKQYLANINPEQSNDKREPVNLIEFLTLTNLLVKVSLKALMKRYGFNSGNLNFRENFRHQFYSN